MFIVDEINQVIELYKNSKELLKFLKIDRKDVIAPVASPEFSEYFNRLIDRANHRIILISTGVSIIFQDAQILPKIIKGVNEEKFKLEIYMAYPYSPFIETRLIEEEIGEYKPDVGKAGLIGRLETLIVEKKKIQKQDNFILKLFWNYPTLALYIVDSDYFFYPYGYAFLGGASPVIHYSQEKSRHKKMIKFLDGQYERIKKSSIDVRIYDLIRKDAAKRELLKDLHTFAVYFIPEQGSALYEFGCKVLGYDVRRRKPIGSDWPNYVGGAADFGFHLTIADALYVANHRQIDLILEEIKFIAREFKSFSLNLELQAGFPDKSSIALICKDDSGSLEAMHHEMVFRFYRQAIASNYSLGLAKADRDTDSQRAALMIQRYHAPYILKKYQPHFTLLTKVPPNEMDKTIIGIKKSYSEVVGETQVNVSCIALVIHANNKPPLAD